MLSLGSHRRPFQLLCHCCQIEVPPKRESDGGSAWEYCSHDCHSSPRQVNTWSQRKEATPAVKRATPSLPSEFGCPLQPFFLRAEFLEISLQRSILFLSVIRFLTHHQINLPMFASPTPLPGIVRKEKPKQDRNRSLLGQPSDLSEMCAEDTRIL